ncbi:MAG: DUF2304 domain-containing protein [Vicinamibacterales bacterium]
MTVFQIVFTIVFALQAAVALGRFARAHHVASLVFAALWIAAIVVVVNPELSTRAARMMGIGRGVDLVIYALLSLFLWAHYQQYLRYKRLENQVTRLVREMAIAAAVRPGVPGASPGTAARTDA